MASKSTHVIVYSSITGLVDSLAAAAVAKGLPMSFRAVNAEALQQRSTPLAAGASTTQAANSETDALENATIAVADPPLIPQLYSQMPHVRWVQSTWAGVDGLFKSLVQKPPQASGGNEAFHTANVTLCAAAAGDAPPPFTLTRCGGQFGPQMAEYVSGHTIAWSRQFGAGAAAQRDSTWCAASLRRLAPLSELTLGVLGGGGGIAASVLAAAKLAFGMQTAAFVSSVRAIPNADHVEDSLDAFLGQCDVVVNLLPSTPSTRGLLDGPALQACAKRRNFNTARKFPEHMQGPLLINVGRGDVVGEESVLEALEQGWLGHAVLDVFQTEPLPESSRLWKHPNVTITPHVAAVSLPQDVANAFCSNAVAFRDDAPASGAAGHETHMQWVVDWQKGY